MTIKDIDDVYKYSDWANDRLAKVINGLPPEEFTKRVGGSFESIRGTLVHMISAEWGWLARCGGPDRGPRLEPEDFHTLDSIKDVWSKVRHARRELLSSLTEEDVGKAITFYNDDNEARSFPLGELMLHAANHNAHHRGQVSLMLRMLGRTPGNVDQLFYNAERRGVPGW